MDKCKDIVQLDDFEVNVITLAMIHEAVTENSRDKKMDRQSARLQSTKEEPSMIRDNDLESVEQLILTVKGIYRIDHLWILPNLTDLNLSCNNIQFIENLNCLPNLLKLNLSCNKIKKIDAIDQLLRLEIFIIHNNEISVLQNFEKLKRLKIFNVKNNKLENLEESVLYLRQFKTLRSLCILGNPCCENFDSLERYVIAYLPQLVYFEYKLVTKSMRQSHREHYARDLEDLEKEEQRIFKENNKEENDEQYFNDQKLAFVENLNRNQLFELMQDRDPYSHIMIMMKGDMPNIYERYKQEFYTYTRQLYEMGKEEYQKREQDMSEFIHTYEDLKAKVNDKNRSIVEDFISKKAFIFYDISQIVREIEQNEEADEQKNKEDSEQNGRDERERKQNNVKLLTKMKSETAKLENKTNLMGGSTIAEKDTHETSDNENFKPTSLDTNSSNNLNDKILELNEIFHDTCNKTYEDVMRNEDILHEQLMDLMSTLDRVYLDNHVDNFIRKAQLIFTNLRDVEKTYMDIIKEHSRKFFNKNIGNSNIPAQLRQILVSADTLLNVLDISDRAQLDTIDDREETMMNSIGQWHRDLIDDMRDEEIARHRRCVNEICHLIDINREELDDIVSDVAFVDHELLI